VGSGVDAGLVGIGDDVGGGVVGSGVVVVGSGGVVVGVGSDSLGEGSEVEDSGGLGVGVGVSSARADVDATTATAATTAAERAAARIRRGQPKTISSVDVPGAGMRRPDAPAARVACHDMRRSADGEPSG
jgi:hypothetical protein